jgi:putative MFS transporter
MPKHVRGHASACSQAECFCAVPIVVFLSYLLLPHRYFGLDGWRLAVLTGVVVCRRARAGSRRKAASKKRTRS